MAIENMILPPKYIAGYLRFDGEKIHKNIVSCLCINFQETAVKSLITHIERNRGYQGTHYGVSIFRPFAQNRKIKTCKVA
jgi:hypothetical protein